MPVLDPLLALPDDDEQLRAALEDADLASLLAAVAHLTGDRSLLRADLRPQPGSYVVQGGLTDAQRATTRAVAFDALVRFRRAGAVPAAQPSEAELVELMEFAVGESVDRRYLGLLEEELEPGGIDFRAPTWHKQDLDAARPFRVVIIGAGMSGLVMAHRFQQAGVDYVVVEKNDDVGGTWLENSYPGCRVDVPNHLYSYSFAQRADWPYRFTPQPVLLDYFRDCADHFDLRKHIRFHTEVIAATFDDDEGVWHLTLRTPDGTEERIEAHAVVSAVGQLNRPSFPDIDGRDSFAGSSFHSAQWDHSLDLRGKRVAVVGTAASAVQLMPTVAAAASELFVFQRTPNWLFVNPDYHATLPDGLRWLFQHVPGYLQWYRFTMFWRTAEGMLGMARVDPEWESNGRSVSAANDAVRTLLADSIATFVPDDADLVAKLVPDYPPLAKRVLLDDGGWIDTLRRDDVHLVTDHIERITPTSVITSDGTEHAVDVIIFATGFTASSFLMPMKVAGRGGVDLHEQWGSDARAYLGLTIPGFPNLFCLYGPNTNIVANGSIIFFSECGTRYVLSCVRQLLEQRVTYADLRVEVHDSYADAIDHGNRAMAWGVSSVNTWYKSASGRITQNWPFTLVEYWQRTRDVDPADYTHVRVSDST